MKVRNIKRKYEYIVYPDSKEYTTRIFKTKRNVMRYLRSMGRDGEDALNSRVGVNVNGINYHNTSHEFFVWFNQRDHLVHGRPFKLVLKKELFRGKKRIFPDIPISKETVRHFSKSEKILSLMSYIGNQYQKNLEPSDGNLKNIINLLKYRFGELPDDPMGYGEDIKTLEDCEWWYWSDRCHYNRASVIIKCIRNEKPYLL